MPDVTSDERGRRIFQIHKERAVESALEKIRQNLGRDWQSFSQDDTRVLADMLGNTWISVERSVWEKASFTRLSVRDIEEIIQTGKDVKSGKVREEKGIETVCTLLKQSC